MCMLSTMRTCYWAGRRRRALDPALVTRVGDTARQLSAQDVG